MTLQRRAEREWSMRSELMVRREAGLIGFLHNGALEGTPVVFLHGFSDMAECWNPLIDRLDLPLPTYALDAPGHGFSPYTGGDFGTQLLERAARFLEGLGRPALLVGHSMGALEAMYLAGDVPDLVRGVVLEDPPMAQDLSPWLPDNIIASLFGSLADLRAMGQAGLVERARELAAHWEDAEFEPWARSKLLVDVAFRDHFVIHREPMHETLAAIACPALLITADAERGGLVTEETAAWAPALCRSMVIAHFPGTGHSVHRDAPSAVADAMRRFLLEQA